MGACTLATYTYYCRAAHLPHINEAPPTGGVRGNPGQFQDKRVTGSLPSHARLTAATLQPHVLALGRHGYAGKS